MKGKIVAAAVVVAFVVIVVVAGVDHFAPGGRGSGVLKTEILGGGPRVRRRAEFLGDMRHGDARSRRRKPRLRLFIP